MQKCPICGEMIDILSYNATQEVTAWFDYNEKFDEWDYESWDNIGIAEGTEPNYCCPECNEVLFNTEDEAKEFLKNGTLPEHRTPYFMERKLSQ